MFQTRDSDLLRLPRVGSSTGVSRSSTYRRISQGLFPPPVPLGGGRSVGWPAREVAAINEARIAGWSDAKIRALVLELVDQRTAGAAR